MHTDPERLRQQMQELETRMARRLRAAGEEQGQLADSLARKPQSRRNMARCIKMARSLRRLAQKIADDAEIVVENLDMLQGSKADSAGAVLSQTVNTVFR